MISSSSINYEGFSSHFTFRKAEPWFQASNDIPKAEGCDRHIFAHNAPLPSSKESLIVQPWWTDVINTKLLNSNHFELIDTATIGAKKPGKIVEILNLCLLDAVGWQKGKPRNEYYIGYVCEWKGARPVNKETFDAEEIGQLVSYLAALSNFQPYRSEISGISSSLCFP